MLVTPGASVQLKEREVLERVKFRVFHLNSFLRKKFPLLSRRPW